MKILNISKMIIIKSIIIMSILVLLCLIVLGIFLINNHNVGTNSTEDIKKYQNQPWVYDAEYGKNKEIKIRDATDIGYRVVDSSKDLIAPYINIDSKDAEIINMQIKEEYEKLYDMFLSMNNKDGFGYAQMKYEYYVNGNILSVIVFCSTAAVPGGAKHYINTYNFNIVTGNKATKEEIAIEGRYTLAECEGKIQEVSRILSEKVSAFIKIKEDSYYLNQNNEFILIYISDGESTHDEGYNLKLNEFVDYKLYRKLF